VYRLRTGGGVEQLASFFAPWLDDMVQHLHRGSFDAPVRVAARHTIGATQEIGSGVDGAVGGTTVCVAVGDRPAVAVAVGGAVESAAVVA
jgi:hypothetical protein